MRMCRYYLSISRELQALALPVNSRVVKADSLNGQIRLWVFEDAEAPLKARKFRVVGTGLYVPPSYIYRGTAPHVGPACQVDLHVFEINDEEEQS